jgi:hypothetical protein
MFTPIGFFAPQGWSFGGVAGATFAYEAQSTTDQGVWIDTTGNGNTGVESAETNNGITHNTDAGGNYWFLDNSNVSSYDTNYVSTNLMKKNIKKRIIKFLMFWQVLKKKLQWSKKKQT